MLHWLCNCPTPYNDVLFATLHEALDGALTVHYLGAGSTPHRALPAEQKPYRWRTIGSRWSDAKLFAAARDPQARFVIGGWSFPVYQRLMLRARGRYAIWTDVPRPGRRRFPLGAARAAVLRLAFAGARKVLVTGAPGIESLRRLGAPRERLEVFPYWIEVPTAPAPFPAEDTPLRLVAVGRLVPVKGFERLAPLVAAAAAAGERLELSIVGDGPERQRLEAAFEPAAGLVEFCGWQQPAEVRRRIAASHALVHPARWEPYGVVVLEAMALGRAVIASNTTMAALDRIRTGANGALFDGADAHDLASTVLETVADRQRLREMGRQAHRTARDWPVERAVPIIRELLR